MAQTLHPSFADRCSVSCGMLNPELTHLVETGFLNPLRILFTPPGLHALPDRLEEHLLMNLAVASIAQHGLVAALGAIAGNAYYPSAVYEEKASIEKFRGHISATWRESPG